MIEPVQQLHDLAARLHAEGKDPHDLTLEVDRLNTQLGRPVHAVIGIVRQLPGLETFDVMDAWRRRWSDPAHLQAMDERYGASEWRRRQLERQHEAERRRDAERRAALDAHDAEADEMLAVVLEALARRPDAARALDAIVSRARGSGDA